jgi:hypothetical protein
VSTNSARKHDPESDGSRNHDELAYLRAELTANRSASDQLGRAIRMSGVIDSAQRSRHVGTLIRSLAAVATPA